MRGERAGGTHHATPAPARFGPGRMASAEHAVPCGLTSHALGLDLDAGCQAGPFTKAHCVTCPMLFSITMFTLKEGPTVLPGRQNTR